MNCPSAVVFEGYRWTCSRVGAREHDFHITDLPIAFVETGLAVLHWGTTHQAPADDHTPRWDGPIYTEVRA